MQLIFWLSILVLVRSTNMMMDDPMTMDDPMKMNDSMTMEDPLSMGGLCRGRLTESMCDASEQCRWNGTCTDKTPRTPLNLNRTN